MHESKRTNMEFKCVMSLEKAIVFKSHPELIVQFLEEKHKCNIKITNIYYARDDKNLKMKNVIFYVKYNFQ